MVILLLKELYNRQIQRITNMSRTKLPKKVKEVKAALKKSFPDSFISTTSMNSNSQERTEINIPISKVTTIDNVFKIQYDVKKDNVSIFMTTQPVITKVRKGKSKDSLRLEIDENSFQKLR